MLKQKIILGYEIISELHLWAIDVELKHFSQTHLINDTQI